jgi:hypothetical protein
VRGHAALTEKITYAPPNAASQLGDVLIQRQELPTWLTGNT